MEAVLDKPIIDESIKSKRKPCKDDVERKERYLEAQKRYKDKKYTCEICNVNITQHEKGRHLRSKKHLNNSGDNNNNNNTQQ